MSSNDKCTAACSLQDAQCMFLRVSKCYFLNFSNACSNYCFCLSIVASSLKKGRIVCFCVGSLGSTHCWEGKEVFGSPSDMANCEPIL